MPAWVTIYCADSVSDVRPEVLLKAISSSDYWTLAEDHGVSEDRVDPAIAELCISPLGDGFQLHYQPEGERQLAIRRWNDPARVAEEAREVLEQIEGDATAAATQIREHMRGLKAVVAVELGFTQLEDMGVVFAYEVARWFAQTRRGLIKGDNENWLRTDDWSFVDL